MEETLIQAATENFNLPHDVIYLPSGGSFYKSKKKSVKVGYLTAADENYLLSNGSKENIVMTLLRNKLYEHDIRPEEMLDGDIEAILIFLRNSSFGPEYTVTLIDPKTDKSFSHTEILDELRIKETLVKPDEFGTFTTTLPKTGSSVKLKPITFFEGLELDKMADNYPAGRVAPLITWRLNKYIVEVNGNSDRSIISQFIEQLPISDSKYIRNFIQDNTPSLDLKRQVLAPSGEKVTFNVSFGVDFFRPFF
jgi:hypothetical protein